jgi:rod shape-determining protein MreC
MLILACIILIGMSATGFIGPIEDLLSIPLSAAESLLGGVVGAVQDLGGGVSEQSDPQLRAYVQELETALAHYQAESFRDREIVQMYERLTDLLDYQTTLDSAQFVIAEVVDRDTSGFVQTIAINRGVRDGIAEGMPVVTEKGLVGQVVRVSAIASRVLLITDRGSAVAARLQSNRVEGVVEGQGIDTLKLVWLPVNVEIAPGDFVLTSGIGYNYPYGLEIGRVANVRLTESGLFQEAEVLSRVDFDRLEQVMVITSFQPVDLSQLEITPIAP